jgi:hypothetical protein
MAVVSCFITPDNFILTFPEDGGNSFLRGVFNHLQVQTVSYADGRSLKRLVHAT